MDRATLIGLFLGFGALIVGFLMEGGSAAGLLNASAAVIVLGGTLGATAVSFPASVLAGVPRVTLTAFKKKKEASASVVESCVLFAEKARRDGLLALEQPVEELEDAFLKKGLLLVVDGSDPEMIQSIMDIELKSIKRRHEAYHRVYETLGGFAPTMGIIGTVMGLINVMANLSEPGELGHAIAVAFVATLYGVGTCNLLYLPLGNKLKANTREELYLREIMLAGILGIQAGQSPRVIREKLESYLPVAARTGQDAPLPSALFNEPLDEPVGQPANETSPAA